MTNQPNEVLFAWIGNADRKALKNESTGEIGSIARAITSDTHQYGKVVLITDNRDNEQESEAGEYIKRLKGYCQRKLIYEISEWETVFCDIDAMDRSAIYKVMQDSIEKYSSPNNLNTYNISGGTPAMHLCWTILGHSKRHYARLIDVSRQKGVEEVKHWIELAHAFIPALPEKASDFFTAQGAEITSSEIIGDHPKIQQAKGLASLIAKAPHSDYPVLIYGETGTGKESMARLIYEQSKPGDEARFIAINCGALSENLLESELFGHKKGAFTGADKDKDGLFIAAGEGGVIFLDEIGDMPKELQTKLLRVLQEKKVTPVGSTKEIEIKNVRIVSATHKLLLEGVRDGWFREDLYYRLNVMEIQLPSLQERSSDLKLLVEHFLKNINAKLTGSEMKEVEFQEDAMQPLLAHNWPGNIRELQNTLRRATLYAQQSAGSKAKIDARLIRELILPSPNTHTSNQDWANYPLENLDIEYLQNDILYHYYQRFIQEKPGVKRQQLAKGLGMSVPILRKLEDDWKKKGLKVSPRQTREKKSKPE